MNRLREAHQSIQSSRLDLRYKSLYGQLTRIETLMRTTEDTSHLFRENLAYYVHLHSQPVSIKEICEYEGLRLIKPDASVESKEYSVGLLCAIFLLRKYIGPETVTCNERKLQPGSYFWEMHVDTSVFKEYSALEKMKTTKRDLNFFYQLTQERLIGRDEELLHGAVGMVGDFVMVGPVSHLNRLLLRKPGLHIYSDFETLPEPLLRAYRDLIMFNVETSNGEVTVDPENFYSVIITAGDLERLLPKPKERE